MKNQDEFYCVNCDEMLTKEEWLSDKCPACGSHTSIREFTCQGNGCDSKETQERSDSYGIFTGHYCEDCYQNNYPYRKDRYFDPAYAGERMDEDY